MLERLPASPPLGRSPARFLTVRIPDQSKLNFASRFRSPDRDVGPMPAAVKTRERGTQSFGGILPDRARKPDDQRTHPRTHRDQARCCPEDRRLGVPTLSPMNGCQTHERKRASIGPVDLSVGRAVGGASRSAAELFETSKPRAGAEIGRLLAVRAASA